MKLSSNSLSMLIFAAIATALFVLMTLRPAVDGNAMNLGVPLSKESTMTTTESVEIVVEDKAVEVKTENATNTAEGKEKENEASESESTTDETVEESKPKDESTDEKTESEN